MASSISIMPPEEENTEINTSPAPKKKSPWSFIPQFRNQFVFCSTAPFIFILVVSYTYMENAPVALLMGYLSDSWENENLRKAAILTNLQDFLSDYFEVIVCQISEDYTGCFTMITFCTAVSTMGLMLLWISAAAEFDMVYVAIFLLALGQAGKTVLEDFLKDELDEKVRAKMESKPEHGNTDNKEKHDHDIFRTNIWSYPAMFAGIILTTQISYVVDNHKNIFKFAALLMGGTYLIFFFGCAHKSRNSYENIPAESTLGKIYRICKEAFKKWKLRAAIVDEPSADSDLSPQGQEEMKGKLCMVKSLVPLIYHGFTFFGYSLVVATGNTFFAEQTSNLKPAYTNSDDTPLLFAAKFIVCKLSLFICWLISFAFGTLRKSAFTRNKIIKFFRFKSITASIIRIGIGMVCAIICCIVAWEVELHRLALINKGIPKDPDREISMTTKALVPQFLLLGMAEGLVEGGLTNLFLDHSSKSMWTFENSFCLMVIGTGKLFTIPIVLILKRCFKETANTSHLDWYYLSLAILNFVFLLAFVYVSFSFVYACPMDEEVEMEHISVHTHQADTEEANAEEENLAAIHEGSRVATGSLYRRTKSKN